MESPDYHSNLLHVFHFFLEIHIVQKEIVGHEDCPENDVHDKIEDLLFVLLNYY